MATFGIKRIYEDPASEDGTRILVDRLWPRGISKERAALDGWHKELAPSPELRKWWGHDAARMDEFAAAYEAELDQRLPHVAQGVVAGINARRRHSRCVELHLLGVIADAHGCSLGRDCG